jgi:alkylation response protein AidB-like acyl-CoA dehydrogenase
MGIRASTTVELTFGLEEPCVGYLVGGSHEGIKQMFMVIEDARMLIGAKAIVDAVDRLPQRPRVRQGAQAGARHHPVA